MLCSLLTGNLSLCSTESISIKSIVEDSHLIIRQQNIRTWSHYQLHANELHPSMPISHKESWQGVGSRVIRLALWHARSSNWKGKPYFDCPWSPQIKSVKCDTFENPLFFFQWRQGYSNHWQTGFLKHQSLYVFEFRCFQCPSVPIVGRHRLVVKGTGWGWTCHVGVIAEATPATSPVLAICQATQSA